MFKIKRKMESVSSDFKSKRGSDFSNCGFTPKVKGGHLLDAPKRSNFGGMCGMPSFRHHSIVSRPKSRTCENTNAVKAEKDAPNPRNVLDNYFNLEKKLTDALHRLVKSCPEKDRVDL